MPARLSDRDLLARLVAFDSVSRNSNLPIVEFIADYLDRSGVVFARNASPEGDKANLVVTLGPEPDGSRAGLLLSGHTDVVPADEDGWASDPFTLTEAEGLYVARGAADMKGFLAVAINRAAGVAPTALRRPLVLVLTYDEELGTLGAKHFVETWPEPERLPRDVIIGEPTSLRAVRMHKGYLKLRVVLRGRAAHSGYPHLGASAIEPAADVVTALRALRRELERELPTHHEWFPEVPYAPLNVGRIEGGVAINVVPDRCVVEFGVRLLPDMDVDAMIDRARARVTRALEGAPAEFSVIGHSPAMLLAEDAAIHRAVSRAIGQTATHSVSFATDAGWLQTTGHQCVIFGPGAIEVAHQPNEGVPVADLTRAGEVLEQLIHRYCVAE